jgi:Putative metallopeptidase
MKARFLFLAFALLVVADRSASARIYIEPLQPVLEQKQKIGGGRYIAYPVSLARGNTIHVEAQIHGGLDNANQLLLVSLENYQLFSAGRQFNVWPKVSPKIAGRGFYSFTAPQPDVYYIVLDNRKNLFARDYTLRINKYDGTTTERSRQLYTLYSARYQALKKLFVFPDFDITFRSCGTVNSFSNPNITICSELLDETQQKNIPEAELWIFSHEVAHSLLNLWHLPDFDNEDSADQFATVLLMMIGHENAALQAAQYWAAQDSRAEANQILVSDDPHSLSVQRARNILKWLNRKGDLERRWLHVLIPHMTEPFLKRMSNLIGAHPSGDPDDASVVREIRDELHKRGSL